MASVVGCPRCNHELLILNDADPEYWAKCPACSIFFQVKNAPLHASVPMRTSSSVDALPLEPDAAASIEPAQKEIPIRASSPTPTIAFSSLQTLHDAASLEGRDDSSPIAGAGAGAECDTADLNTESATDRTLEKPVDTPKRSAGTVRGFANVATVTSENAAPAGGAAAVPVEPSPSSLASGKAVEAASIGDVVSATAEPEETPFHSAKTVADVPPLPRDPTSGVPEHGIGRAEETPAAVTLSQPTVRPDTTIAFSGDLSGSPADDADFDIADSSESPESAATWDDSEQMERLLASHDSVPAAVSDEMASEDSSQYYSFINSELFVPTASKQRRRPRSLVRMLAGVAISGLIGTAIGYYILLALRGADGDVLNVAQYLPRAILPGSFSPVTYTANRETVVENNSQADQASFHAPLEKSDIQPSEPSTFSPSDATPIAKTAAQPVSGAPSFTVDQLARSLQAAKEAQPGLVTGSLDDGYAVRKTKGTSYEVLCGLAHETTFVDAASTPDDVRRLQEGADELFRETLTNVQHRGEAARIVPVWTKYKQRAHGGIFFAGTVTSDAAKGDIIECRVDLGAGEPLTVLILPALVEQVQQSARPLGFVGSIVDRPSESVTGYQGDATQAVWIGRVIQLD